MKKQISISLSYSILAMYCVMAVVLFFSYGLPSLEGQISQQLYSDTITYEEAAHSSALDDELVSIGGNYLGPVLVLWLFDFNRILIHLFNLSILFFSAVIAFRHLNIDRSIFLVAILTSPLLFFSTFGVNKEIFLLPLSVCLLVYFQNRRLIWLALSLFLAFFARWQLVLFVLLVFLATSKITPFSKKRGWILIGLIGLLSIIYPFLASEIFTSIEQISIEGAEDEVGSQASGVYPKMQEIQRSYGYFLVVIPKTMQLLIGFLGRFSIESIELDFWNNFVIMAECLHNLFLLGFVFIFRKLDLSDDHFFLICFFAAVFALTPVFAPRYFFPIGIWLALWLASRGTSPIKKVTNQLLKNQIL